MEESIRIRAHQCIGPYVVNHTDIHTVVFFEGGRSHPSAADAAGRCIGHVTDIYDKAGDD